MLRSPFNLHWSLMPLALLALATAANAQSLEVSAEREAAQVCRQQMREHKSQSRELRVQYTEARKQDDRVTAAGLREQMEALRSQAEQQGTACFSGSAPAN